MLQSDEPDLRQVGALFLRRCDPRLYELLLGAARLEFGAVEDIDVCVNVDHPRPNDLKLTLKHVPTGTEVVLFDGTACSQPNVRLYFDDGAGNAICPLNGAVRPGEPLSAFDGEQVHGEWELTFADVISGQTGKALGFTLYYLYGD